MLSSTADTKCGMYGQFSALYQLTYVTDDLGKPYSYVATSGRLWYHNCLGMGLLPLKIVRVRVQGLPLGSGMGSSAASAAAGAWAVNTLFGGPLSKEQLVPAGLVSEATVSGYHADNIAPALLGGFILIRWAAHCACSS